MVSLFGEIWDTVGPHAQSEVDRIGWATAICYGLVIPCFLGFLFAKQNVVMRKVKTVLMHTTCDDGKVRVWLQGLESKQSFKDRVCAKVADVCPFPPQKGLLGKPQATRCHEYISMTYNTARKHGNPIVKQVPVKRNLSRNDVMHPLLMRPTVQSRMSCYPSAWRLRLLPALP